MKLKESLEKKKFVVTSEVQVPIDEEPQALIKLLELVRGRVDGVTVPELEIEGIVGDSIKVCTIWERYHIRLVLWIISMKHLICCQHIILPLGD